MTREQVANYTALVTSACDFIKDNNIYSEKSITQFKSYWRRLQSLMIANKIDEFTDSSAKQLAESVKGLPNSEALITAINKLAEYQVTGQITCLKWWRKKRGYVFEGPMASLIKGFLLEAKQNLSLTRSNHFETNLHPFCEFCNEHKLTEFNLVTVLLYVRKKQFRNPRKMEYGIQCLVRLTRYLYTNGILATDFSQKIPRFQVVKQPTIPSVYTIEEIQKIIATIDRSSPKGKRDYAIMIMVIRLGIRISDVANLKMKNINLEKEEIGFVQQKTNRPIVLPLLDEVRHALVQYLKHGRRKSTEPYLFLMEFSPFGKMSLNSIAHIFNRAITESGVKAGRRTSGPRAFRSSLASAMLKKNIALPQISQSLGHAYLNMAKHYMRIDTNSLSKCIHEVPQIDPSFYTKNGFIP